MIFIKNGRDQQIGDKLKELDRGVSQYVRSSIDHILSTLPDAPDTPPVITETARRQTFGNKRYIALVVAIVLSLGIGFYPQMIYALKQIPLVQSIFERIGDDNLKSAHDKGWFAELGQVVEDHGLSLQLTEVLYDKSDISIAFLLTSKDGFTVKDRKEDGFDDIRIIAAVNGKKIDNYGYSSRGSFIDNNRYAGVIQIKSMRDLPHQFQLNMNVEKIGRTWGEWDFSFPVSLNEEANQTIFVMNSMSYKNVTVNVEKLVISASSIDIIGTGKGIMTPDWNFEMVDGAGREIAPKGSISKRNITSSGLELEWKASFEAANPAPLSVTIRPHKAGVDQLDPEFVKKMEMTIPIK